jgi:hypothetical protein
MSMSVTLSTGRYWLDDEGFLRGECADGANPTLEDAREQVAAQRPMAGGKRRPFLMDITRVRMLSRDARNYFAGPESAEVFLVVALVVGSPISRAIGNFFLGLSKPLMPTRLFTTEAEGLAWLRERAREPAR